MFSSSVLFVVCFVGVLLVGWLVFLVFCGFFCMFEVFLGEGKEEHKNL